MEKNRPPKEVGACGQKVISRPAAVAAAIFIYRYRGEIAGITSPFFVTVILVYIVKPLSDRLTAKKIPTGVSVLLVPVHFCCTGGIGFYFIPSWRRASGADGRCRSMSS